MKRKLLGLFPPEMSPAKIASAIRRALDEVEAEEHSGETAGPEVSPDSESRALPPGRDGKSRRELT